MMKTRLDLLLPVLVLAVPDLTKMRIFMRVRKAIGRGLYTWLLQFLDVITVIST
jgi:hypothetical protein